MVVHGRNGWELVDYDWCEKTGKGTLTYERERLDTLEIETRVVVKQQPATSRHDGWKK